MQKMAAMVVTAVTVYEKEVEMVAMVGTVVPAWGDMVEMEVIVLKAKGETAEMEVMAPVEVVKEDMAAKALMVMDAMEKMAIINKDSI